MRCAMRDRAAAVTPCSTSSGCSLPRPIASGSRAQPLLHNYAATGLQQRSAWCCGAEPLHRRSPRAQRGSCLTRVAQLVQVAEAETPQAEIHEEHAAHQAPTAPRLPAPGHFVEDSTVFEQDFVVRGYEVSPNQRASMVTIANLLQEVAGNHAVGTWGRSETGFGNIPGVEDLIFVMTRLQVRMTEYPKWGDMLRLQAYFTREGRLTVRRDWVVSDAITGKQLGMATSTWVNITASTRKLAKLPAIFTDDLIRFAVPQTRHVLPISETKRKLPNMDPDSQVEGQSQIARRSDMDMNGHINNTVYLAWALEAVPQDMHDNYTLSEVEIDFKAECTAGDLVQSGIMEMPKQAAAALQQHGPGQRQLLHTLQRCEKDEGCTELVRARTTWHVQQELL